MNFDILTHKTKLSTYERKIAELVGEQNSLIRRREILTNEVGLAKGRLANKVKVSEFLEQLQNDANSRLVSNYEMLLTALVQEVLTNEAPIGLNLQIERGQPSLDIVSRRSTDRSEDIYEDQGGALTNLVSLGLRMIGVVRSGMSKFLVLDESDCWVATDKVPPFYAVVKDAARKIGIQCLAVSHHDIATFSDGVSIAKLSGHPELPGGVKIENSPRPYHWKNEEQGIRWIRLKNFQGYVDETLHLTPEVNALVGTNNIGKSSFVRAFRAVFYGEARDSLIRWGESMCTVEFGMPNGRVLVWDRKAKRNPVNRWRYLESDGSLVSEEFNTGGRAVPEWVMTEFKIGPLEGMDIHAIKQKEPVFLLNQTASKRAAVLSIGQEASHIKTMLNLHKDQCNLDSIKVKEGESEMNSLLDRLDKLEKILAMKNLVSRAEGFLAEIEKTTSINQKLENVIQNLHNTFKMKSIISKQANTLATLPEIHEIRKLEKEVSHTDILIKIERSLLENKQKVLNNKSILTTLESLPTKEPIIIDNEKLVKIGSEIKNLNTKIAKYQQMNSSLNKLPAITPNLNEVDTYKTVLTRIIDSKQRIKKQQNIVKVLNTLPNELPTIIFNDELIKKGKNLRDTKLLVKTVETRIKVLEKIPNEMPLLINDKEKEIALNKIVFQKQNLEKILEKQNQVDNDIKNIEVELEEIVGSMGHTCPLCHHEINDPSTLLTHTREHKHG